MRSIVAHRADADPVLLYGSLRLGDGQRLAVTITNVSPDGCKLDVSEMLPVGAVVELDVPDRMVMHANVRWSTQCRAGLQFV